MKNKLLIAFLTLLAVACAPAESTEESTTKSTGNTAPFVEVVKPSKIEYSTSLDITGNLVANQEVMVHAMEGGALTDLRVDIGDMVKSGMILATMSNPPLVHELNMARADLGAKESAYNRLDSIYKNIPQLTKVDDFEKAQAAYESAKAQVSGLESRVSFLNVKAPFDGVITKRFVDRGSMIQSAIDNTSAAALFEIKDLNTLRLVVEFPESDLRFISDTTRVQVEFPEVPGMEMELGLSRTSNALNPMSKTMRMEFDIENSGSLDPGMYANVHVPLKSEDDALSVPIMALTADKKGKYVFKVTNGKAKKIKVGLGLEDEKFIEVITDELSENDMVVVQGKTLISDGLEVQAKIKK